MLLEGDHYEGQPRGGEHNLKRNSVTKHVVRPKFDLETHLDAAVQEESDDLTFSVVRERKRNVLH